MSPAVVTLPDAILPGYSPGCFPKGGCDWITTESPIDGSGGGNDGSFICFGMVAAAAFRCWRCRFGTARKHGDSSPCRSRSVSGWASSSPVRFQHVPDTLRCCWSGCCPPPVLAIILISLLPQGGCRKNRPKTFSGGIEGSINRPRPLHIQSQEKPRIRRRGFFPFPVYGTGRPKFSPKIIRIEGVAQNRKGKG